MLLGNAVHVQSLMLLCLHVEQSMPIIILLPRLYSDIENYLSNRTFQTECHGRVGIDCDELTYCLLFNQVCRSGMQHTFKMFATDTLSYNQHL